MKNLLRSEQLAQLALVIAALYYQPIHFAWWQWPLLFMAPDISAVGYLLSNRAGAFLYNIAHHKGVAGGLIAAGLLANLPVLYLAGLLLWGHSSFDRLLGYGLKYEDSFQHTHLGMIGHKR